MIVAINWVDDKNVENLWEKNEIIKRFDKSWNLYHEHLNKYIKNNKVIYLNKLDLNSYEKLINNIKNQGK